MGGYNAISLSRCHLCNVVDSPAVLHYGGVGFFERLMALLGCGAGVTVHYITDNNIYIYIYIYSKISSVSRAY